MMARCGFGRCAAALVVIVAAVLAGTGGAVRAEVIDGFVDGGVELTSNGSPVGGNYSAPSVPKGRRTVSFNSNTGSGTLTIDNATQTLTLATTGSARVLLGYGYTSSGGSGVNNDYRNRLDADWTDYDTLRIPVLSNDQAMTITVDVATQRLAFEARGAYEGSSTSGSIRLDQGWTGNLDLRFADFTGDVQWSDVDYLLINAASIAAGSGFTLGPIQLVPEPGSLAILAGAAAGILRRRRPPAPASRSRDHEAAKRCRIPMTLP